MLDLVSFAPGTSAALMQQTTAQKDARSDFVIVCQLREVVLTSALYAFGQLLSTVKVRLELRSDLRN